MSVSIGTLMVRLSATLRRKIVASQAKKGNNFADRVTRTQGLGRCIGAIASVVVVSAAYGLVGAGTASAMPRDCKTYANALQYQAQWEDYWLGQWTTAVSNSNWGELHTDIRQYQSAVAGYNRVVKETAAAGC